MHAIVAGLTLLFSSIALAWIEEERVLGQGTTLTVYATYDVPAVLPLLEAFSNANPDLKLIYRVASSQDLYDRVLRGELPDADLVFSSAVALQVDSVNRGLAQRFSVPAPQAPWRAQLYTLSVEPIVSIYNRKKAPWIGQITDRNQMTAQLQSGLRILPDGAMTYDPSVSGVGYQLLTQDAEQSNSFWAFYGELEKQRLELACCTSDMINAVASGQRDLATNLLQSYVLPLLDQYEDLAIKIWTDYQLVLPRTAWIPKTAPNSTGAQEFVRFFMGEGQVLLPQNNRLERPMNLAAPQKPIRLTPSQTLYLDRIKRDQFLHRWNQLSAGEVQ